MAETVHLHLEANGEDRFFRWNPTVDGTIEQFYTVAIKQGRIASIKQVVPTPWCHDRQRAAARIRQLKPCDAGLEPVRRPNPPQNDVRWFPASSLCDELAPIFWVARFGTVVGHAVVVPSDGTTLTSHAEFRLL